MGPSSPEEYVQELIKYDFTNESVSEVHYGTIDKLRVSLSTNGLRYVDLLLLAVGLCIVDTSVCGGWGEGRKLFCKVLFCC